MKKWCRHIKQGRGTYSGLLWRFKAKQHGVINIDVTVTVTPSWKRCPICGVKRPKKGSR